MFNRVYSKMVLGAKKERFLFPIKERLPFGNVTQSRNKKQFFSQKNYLE